MIDDLELRLRRFYSSGTLNMVDEHAIAKLGTSGEPLAANPLARRPISRHLLVRSALALSVVLLTFTLGVSFGELQPKPQVVTTMPLANQLAQTGMVQSAPTSWAQASTSAQAAGDTLVQPRWLPFDAGSPAVQQSVDSRGQLLFTSSQYTSTSGTAWVLVGQAHIKVIGTVGKGGPVVKYEHPIGTVAVGSTTGTIFQLPVSTRTSAFTDVGIGWVGAHDKLLTVTARGVSLDDLVKVARSIN